MPVVSIVIPTRNRAELLRRTLRAACAQVEVDLEIIVIDDGSTDATSQTVADAGDGRIRYIRNHSAAGVSAARNRGIAAAKGEWISFLDDDDVWAPEKLAHQLTAAEQAGADWVYSGDVIVDKQLRILSGGPPPDPTDVLTLLPRWNPLASGGSNVMVRSDLLATVGMFDPELHRTEDWDLWIRIARTGPPARVCEPLVAYRLHAGNVVADPGGMVDEARLLASRHGIPVDLAAMHRRAAWSALRGGQRMLAVRHYSRAVVRGDIRSVGRAAVALVHPAVGSDGVFDLLDRDADWIAKARRWLDTFDPPSATGDLGLR